MPKRFVLNEALNYYVFISLRRGSTGGGGLGGLNPPPPWAAKKKKKEKKKEKKRKKERTLERNPFKCKYCEKIFNSSGNLTKHMITLDITVY